MDKTFLVCISSTIADPSHIEQGASGEAVSHSEACAMAGKIMVCRNNEFPSKGAVETSAVHRPPLRPLSQQEVSWFTWSCGACKPNGQFPKKISQHLAS